MQENEHEMVREQILRMQEISGAAIRPIELGQVFFKHLEKSSGSRMNVVKARNMADVFCALCNEFYIMNVYRNTPEKEFYMAQSKWKKYLLRCQAVKNSIIELAKMGLISYHKEPCPNEPMKALIKYRIHAYAMELLNDKLEKEKQEEQMAEPV